MGQSLLLSARQAVAALADDRVVPVGQVGNDFVDLGRLSGLDQLSFGSVGPGIPEVVAYRLVEQVRVLVHHTDRTAKRRLSEVADIDSIDQKCAIGHVVKTRDQRDEGGLAGPGGTDDGNRLSRLDVEIDVVEDLGGDRCPRLRSRAS